MGAKRFYLCNLIPLWEIDDDKLDVDWGSNSARDGDSIELRVVVSDLPLEVDPPDFSVRFDIMESDFLLTGGLDDRAAKIEAPSKRSDDAEVRPFKLIGENELPVGSDVLHHIFLTRLAREDDRERVLIRCFWKAERQDDVFGHPEYYFDFTIEVDDQEREERSDRELVVHSAAGGFGKGLGLRSLELERAVVLGVPPAPNVQSAGWSKPSTPLGEAVQLIAIVDGASAGHPLTFEILSDSTDDAEILERIDTVIERNGVQSVGWVPPRPFPLTELSELSFRAYVEYLPDRIAYSETNTYTFGKETIRMEGRLQLEADLEVEVLDEGGRPEAGVKYHLERPDGTLLSEGFTDSRGRIAVPRLGGGEYHVRLEGVSLLDAAEPDAPARPPPETDSLVFSVVQLFPPPTAEATGPTTAAAAVAEEERSE